MGVSTRASARTAWTALRMLIVLTVILGLVYPLAMTGLGQTLLPGRADGSIITDHDGEPIGSTLLGQQFTDSDGHPLPEYFQSRPSAYDYSGAMSGGSNLGPNNPELIERVRARRIAIAEFDGVSVDDVPADAVTASGSGLDPDISTAYALIQIDRVAAARHIGATAVHDLVDEHRHGRTLGFIGTPGVNVLELNLALDDAYPMPGT